MKLLVYKLYMEGPTNAFLFMYYSRLSTLLKEIMAEKENKSIVFIETKRRVDEITRKMKRDGWVMIWPD